VADAEPRIRRRAALAIGRVGLAEGARALQPLLTDTDAEVRQMAAFALGLLADKDSIAALTAALQDLPLMRLGDRPTPDLFERGRRDRLNAETHRA